MINKNKVETKLKTKVKLPSYIIKKYGLKQEKFVVRRRENVHSIGEHRKIPGKNVVGIYIDKKVPSNLMKPYIFHESIEDALERQKKLTYPHAHLIASHEEHKRFFKNSPKKWKRDLDFGKNLYNARRRKMEIAGKGKGRIGEIGGGWI